VNLQYIAHTVNYPLMCSFKLQSSTTATVENA